MMLDPLELGSSIPASAHHLAVVDIDCFFVVWTVTVSLRKKEEEKTQDTTNKRE